MLMLPFVLFNFRFLKFVLKCHQLQMQSLVLLLQFIMCLFYLDGLCQRINGILSLETSNNFVDFFSFSSHFVKLFLKDINEEQNYLDFILELL